MLTFKILLALFVIGFTFLILLVAGETYAMENKHPKFTAWWRKYIIGIKD